LQILNNFESLFKQACNIANLQVHLVGTMGHNVGWMAASSLIFQLYSKIHGLINFEQQDIYILLYWFDHSPDCVLLFAQPFAGDNNVETF